MGVKDCWRALPLFALGQAPMPVLMRATSGLRAIRASSACRIAAPK